MSAEYDPNPALYRRLSQPKPDFETVDTDLKKFHDGLAALREECGVADVTVIVEVPYVNKHDREVSAFGTYHFGHLLNKFPMLARAYGASRAESDLMIGELVAETRKANV